MDIKSKISRNPLLAQLLHLLAQIAFDRGEQRYSFQGKMPLLKSKGGNVGYFVIEENGCPGETCSKKVLTLVG